MFKRIVLALDGSPSSQRALEVTRDIAAEQAQCSAIAGVVVGSVAHRLLHIAPCPVLVVRPARD